MPHPDNPFFLPGMVNARQALTPWLIAQHDNHYAEIDHAVDAFAAFTSEAVSGASLITTGRLVVVTGNRRCGKSSILNRCVFWVKQRFSPQQSPAEAIQISTRVADLRQVEPPGPRLNAGPEEWKDAISHALVWDCLGEELQLKEVENLSKYPPVHRVRTLGKALQEGPGGPKALLVILPRTEVSARLIDYAELAAPGVVMFCENVPDRKNWQAGLNGDRPEPIEVEVGPLLQTDAEKFATMRTSRDGVSTNIPLAIEFALANFQRARGEMTIGELQELMYDIYETVLGTHPRPSINELFITQRALALALRAAS